MIKSLNRDDIQITPFIAAKEWNVQNLEHDDLILWMSGSLSGSISHIYIDFEDGTSSPITNSYCSLALQQQDSQSLIQYQHGTNITGTFYPADCKYYTRESNPRNVDGTYMRVIYNTHKTLFYNTYGDPTKLFGLENINLNSAARTLTSELDVFTLRKSQLGDKIIPSSVKIIDAQYDQPYVMVDDGNTNLILSGSYFDDVQEMSI
jgi:hypothetical protein